MNMYLKQIVLATSALLASSGAFALDAAAAKALASKSACLACHAVDKKLVGPAYKDVAAKHQGPGRCGGKSGRTHQVGWLWHVRPRAHAAAAQPERRRAQTAGRLGARRCP